MNAATAAVLADLTPEQRSRVEGRTGRHVDALRFTALPDPDGLLIPAALTVPDDAINLVGLRIDLTEALSKLTPIDRLVVTRLSEGYSQAELGREIGCTSSTVRRTADRGFARLRALLGYGYGVAA